MSDSLQSPRSTSLRGFASMNPELQRQIASKGGKAAHQRGTAHEFDSREAAEAGRKGGQAVSRDRKHMAMIGAEGGRARSLRGKAQKAAAAAVGTETEKLPQ